MHRSSGIGTYLRNLVPFFVERHEVTLLGVREEIMEYDFSCNVHIIDFCERIYSIREQIRYPIKIPPCDIYWSPHYNVPLVSIRALKRVVTIHDVFHLAYSRELSFVKRFYARLMMNRAVNWSDLVLTVSNFTKNEIERYLRVKKPIEVVPNGVNREVFKPIREMEVLENVRRKYGLPSEFILFVGNLKPHKNLSILIEATEVLGLNLVIVGRKENLITMDKGVIERVNKGVSLGMVYLLGYVEEKDLVCLYNLASLMVFPSLYEGFGLPPLEAQACGCPVLCSDIEVHREVLGDSVCYFDPKDKRDLVQKIWELMRNERKREMLVERGYKNVVVYDWSKVYERIEYLIESLLKK